MLRQGVASGCELAALVEGSRIESSVGQLCPKKRLCCPRTGRTARQASAIDLSVQKYTSRYAESMGNTWLSAGCADRGQQDGVLCGRALPKEAAVLPPHRAHSQAGQRIERRI